MGGRQRSRNKPGIMVEKVVPEETTWQRAREGGKKGVINQSRREWWESQITRMLASFGMKREEKGNGQMGRSPSAQIFCEARNFHWNKWEGTCTRSERG